MQQGPFRISPAAPAAPQGTRTTALARAVLVGRQLLLGLSGTLATICWLWLNAPPPL